MGGEWEKHRIWNMSSVSLIEPSAIAILSGVYGEDTPHVISVFLSCPLFTYVTGS